MAVSLSLSSQCPLLSHVCSWQISLLPALRDWGLYHIASSLDLNILHHFCFKISPFFPFQRKMYPYSFTRKTWLCHESHAFLFLLCQISNFPSFISSSKVSLKLRLTLPPPWAAILFHSCSLKGSFWKEGFAPSLSLVDLILVFSINPWLLADPTVGPLWE